MITFVEDILLIVSVLLFFTGFFDVIKRPIRRRLKTIHEKFRLRHLSLASLLCFTLGLALGWKDVVKGYNDARYEFSNSVGVDGEP